MSQLEITPDSIVEEIMRLRPQTVRVFLRHKMACVGCSVGPFHTLADASAEHGIDLDQLIREIEHAASASVEERAREHSLPM